MHSVQAGSQAARSDTCEACNATTETRLMGSIKNGTAGHQENTARGKIWTGSSGSRAARLTGTQNCLFPPCSVSTHRFLSLTFKSTLFGGFHGATVVLRVCLEPNDILLEIQLKSDYCLMEYGLMYIPHKYTLDRCCFY